MCIQIKAFCQVSITSHKQNLNKTNTLTYVYNMLNAKKVTTSAHSDKIVLFCEKEEHEIKIQALTCKLFQSDHTHPISWDHRVCSCSSIQQNYPLDAYVTSRSVTLLTM